MAILIGTSGYDYPEWVGADCFYPPGLAKSRRDWLTYYASRFPLVELNFTYYSETNPEQLARMIERVNPARPLTLIEGTFTPREDFSFVIKAYASLTHRIEDDWPWQAAKFAADIAPLRESGKLTGVLAQFPSRFRAGKDATGYVANLAEALAPMTLIAEFRHERWFTGDARERLARHGVVLCGVDAPEEAKLPSVLAVDEGHDRPDDDASGDEPSPGVVQPFRYTRLHGRREGSWWSGDAASRYEYRYSQGQLEQLARRLANSPVARDYVLFNNHRHGDAARNARQLEKIIAGLAA